MNPWDALILASKKQLEHHDRQKKMAGFRRQIAPADAITLRCNHPTIHVNENAPPQGNEIRASEKISAY